MQTLPLVSVMTDSSSRPASLAMPPKRCRPLIAEPEGPEVSVIIPCLNEARTIAGCIDKALAALNSLPVQGEVIVADNGSSDGSPALARARGARVVLVS